MSELRRIVLIRHGNTVGNSHERFHGSADVALSAEGREQMHETGRKLAREVFELVVASPLRRSWEGATLLSGGHPVRLMPEFSEIHFGRWEGLTAEEIRSQDPVLYQSWQERAPDFEFPGGEPRAVFRERVAKGVADLKASGARNVLAVLHKGVIRAIAEELLGEPLAKEAGPELGESISVTRDGDSWFLGRRSSDPPALRGDAAA